MTIDSHIHFWKYHPVKDAWITDDMKIIQRDFLPQDLLPVLQENKTDGCIAVQADQSEAETNFLLQCANENSFVKGVVGWIDLKANDLDDRLQYFLQFKKLKGFRHIVQAEPDGFLLDEKFIDGIKLLHQYNLTYDILIVNRQLKEAAAFINKLPSQKLIIDHCAKPDIKNVQIKEWALLMKELASHTNVYCKLSGLFTEADWSNWKEEDFYPYLDVVFETFGTQRLLFGSDWPVMLLAGNYTKWKNLVEKYMQRFTDEEREAVFGNNAIEFYNL